MRTRQTFIRKLANTLPLQPAKRIYLHPDIIGKVSSDDDHSDTSSSSGGSMLWDAPVPLSLSDVVWLASDCGDPSIKTRVQLLGQNLPLWYSPRIHIGDDTLAHGSGYNFRAGYETRSNLSGISFTEPNAMSTPVNKHNSDSVSASRISELEEELEKLRRQVASLVLLQETHRSFADVSAGGNTTAGSVAPPPAAPPPPTPPPCLAPPPPPPPPPCFSTPTKSVVDIIKEKKAKKADTEGKTPNQAKRPAGPVDMTEVLKGIGSVKLRAIKRSPGGTPLREKPKPCEVNDPAAIIAQALKRKFSARHTYSPEKENSPINHNFEKSPKITSRRNILKAKHHMPLTDVNGLV